MLSWHVQISFWFSRFYLSNYQLNLRIAHRKVYKIFSETFARYTSRWRHNDHAGVSNHQPHGCLLNRLFRRTSKKTSKLRVTGLCAGNSPGTGEFPAQMASYAENVSIWWRHHDIYTIKYTCREPNNQYQQTICYETGIHSWSLLEEPVGLFNQTSCSHYGDVIMGTIASQITSLTIVYSTVDSDADQRIYQSSASLAFVWGIHRGPVNSPHKWSVTRKMFSFDDVIMQTSCSNHA